MSMSLNDDRDGLASTAEPFFDAWNPSPSSGGTSLPDINETVERSVAPPPPPRRPVLTDETMERPDLSAMEPQPKVAFTSVDPPVSAATTPRRAVKDTRPTLNTASLDRADRPIVFPKIGEAIGGFRLVSELGRGAFARVYLAHEIALGNRPVALKVSKAEGDEPQILARLQHANIVPINSLHDDPVTRLRLICMPYLGGANLAQVLEAAGTRSPVQTQGRSLVDALDLIGHPVVSQRPVMASRVKSRRAIPTIFSDGATPIDAGPHPSHAATLHRSLLGRIPWWPRTRSLSVADPEAVTVSVAEENHAQPARQFLCESSYVRASAWIMARLAEGLEHAHSRGLLHRDLKPPNILVAADGTPMLLDFNLAADSVEPTDDEAEKAKMGGTLPYMAPEHLDAFNPRGSTAPEAVDERSDIYALGLILFEMIAGRPAFPDPPLGLNLLDLLSHMTAERRQSAPSIRATSPEVPWGLDAIVAKCLDPVPDRRYRSARELAEDLRRFLDDQPLKYTTDPSLRERVVKWSRRHPRASSAWTIGPAALTITIVVGMIAWGQATHLRQVATRLNFRRFHEEFNECQFLLNTSSGGDLTDHLRKGVDKARTAIDRYQIARRGDWDRTYWVTTLAPDERMSLRRDLAELILLESRARVILAEKEGTEVDRRKALERAVVSLDRAEALDPAPSPALFSDRADYHRALGRADLARKDRERAESTPASSCRDDYLLGTADLAARRFDRAEGRLGRAVALDPGRFWAWFALGLCHADQGRFADAVGDFNVCTVLMPNFAWPFANRGNALARTGRLDEAVASFDRAVALSPDFADALAGRGLLHLEAGRAEAAARDLGRAIELGSRDLNARAGLAEAMAKLGRLDQALATYANLIADRPDLARLRASRGMIRLASDPDGARSDFADALRLDPKLALAHLGVARLLYRSDLSAALAEATAAVAYDPGLYDAIQLRALIHARLGRPEAIGDVDRLVQAPTPHRLYNAACAMAVLSKSLPDPRHEARALELLRRAIETGFPPATARSDSDFKPYHARPDFRKLVGLASTSK